MLEREEGSGSTRRRDWARDPQRTVERADCLQTAAPCSYETPASAQQARSIAIHPRLHCISSTELFWGSHSHSGAMTLLQPLGCLLIHTRRREPQSSRPISPSTPHHRRSPIPPPQARAAVEEQGRKALSRRTGGTRRAGAVAAAAAVIGRC